MDKEREKEALDLLRQHIAEEVWFRIPTGDVREWQGNNLCHGILIYVGVTAHDIKIYRIDPHKQGYAYIPVEHIFLKKEELLADNYKRFTARVDNYAGQIKDVADLVKFCYSHHTSVFDLDEHRELTDYDAQLAARKMAMELLGIEIDPEASKREAEIEKFLS